ncbi:MAG: nicotinate (nicotinamide) nucleotide adenylyltransferase [Ignavibacteriales bacterium]|nr:nicotinate (nicotinamide) nucleotide adenylyltransferase [Ignavibacteriales bacterium]
MEPIGIFGGTFDPIHIGHLINAQVVFEKRNLERIIFIPCHISPHKLDRISSSDDDRLNMLKLAISDHPYFDYSDFEINQGDISYTYHTLIEFKKKYEEIELIIGYDNLLVFDKWFEPDKIFDMARVVVMQRPFEENIKSTNKYFSEAIIINTPFIDISSTELRQRVKQKLPLDFFVPEKVRDYIIKNELYIK